MGFGLGGFLTGSKAKSKETMKSEYLKSIRTPEAMEVPDWAKTMTQEFMKSFYGPEYYEQVTREKPTYTEDEQRIITKTEKDAKYHDGRSKIYAAKYEQTGDDWFKRASKNSADRRDVELARLEVYKPAAEEELDFGQTPYQQAMEGAYGEVRGAKEDILDYLHREKGAVPEATKASLAKYSDLLSTMVERSLAGEAIIPEIGLPETGFAGLLDRLTSPVSIGLEGHGGMSFVPKGSAEALAALFSGRESALEQFKGWGSERAEMDIIPELTRQAYGREPLDYALGMAEQTPAGGSLLQQLADVRSMWAPVSETAMQLGGQVPLVTETEDVEATSRAKAMAFGAGASGSVGGGGQQTQFMG